jgi:hypothetical protein
MAPGGWLRAAEPVTITEFVASNTSGLRDEDGAYSDWIEILNAGTNTVNLNGWFLTDTEANRTKWRFPATNVPPSGFLIVFASGKNRAVAGAPLHANFSLNADGEYLALVKPDGVSIASGVRAEVSRAICEYLLRHRAKPPGDTALAMTSPVRVFVPTNGNLAPPDGRRVRRLGFGAPAPTASTRKLRARLAVRNIRANIGVCDLGTADGVLAEPAQQAAVCGNARGHQLLSTDSTANFPGDFTFPGFTIGVDENNFVTEATGILTIPTAGNWSFGVNSDDGFRCTIGSNVFRIRPRAVRAIPWPRSISPPAITPCAWFFTNAAGAEVEFFAASGVYAAFNAAFRLVGNTAGGGLAVKSLPTGASGSLRPLIATDVQANLLNRNSSAYVRLPFTVSNPAAFSSLTLRMKYDDGFVAYLNGTEVARRNSPAAPLWNAAATTSHPGSNVVVFEDIDVTSRLGGCKPAPMSLPFRPEFSANDTDFLLSPNWWRTRFSA